jgi:hypothetical protein
VAAFYLDHNVAQGTALALRRLGHRATTARDLRLDDAPDDEHLLLAAEQARILVSYNLKDFVLLHSAWLRWSHAWGIAPRHAGILLIPSPPRLPSEQAARELSAFIAFARPLPNELYSLRLPGTWYRWLSEGGWTT